MSGLNMAQKRSFVDAFLQKEADESSSSKKATRLELARAKNRKETAYQNMLKTQERTNAMIEKLREEEAVYEAAGEDVDRLKTLLNDDNDI